MSSYERLVAALYRDEEITRVTPPTPLIDGVLDLDSTATIYGRAGRGKSFVVLDWAMSIVTGQPWWGHDVAKGPVLYVLGEGVSGTSQRYAAWLQYHGHETTNGLTFLSVAPNLTVPQDRDAAIRLVEELQPRLTIFDTLARHLPGGDENTGPVMSVMVETMDEVRRACGGCACVVHHTGWEADHLRGHSSLEGAVDTAIHLKPVEGDASLMDVYCRKQKNHEDDYSILTLKLARVEDSAVTIPVDSPLSAAETLALETLSSLNGQNGHRRWVESHEWLDACKVAGLSKASFYRYRRTLAAGGWIIAEGSQSQVSDKSQ